MYKAVWYQNHFFFFENFRSVKLRDAHDGFCRVPVASRLARDRLSPTTVHQSSVSTLRLRVVYAIIRRGRRC